MSLWFTDATVAFAKETLSNLENTEKENAEIEEQLLNYGRRLKQFETFRSVTVEGSGDESFYKNVYVGIEPDNVMQKPVLLDEAIEILSKKVSELEEQLKFGKQHEDVYSGLLAEITKAYPGILDEIND